MPKIISRDEALKKNLSRYYTGIPCRKGHLSERNTKSQSCYECDRERRPKKFDPSKITITYKLNLPLVTKKEAIERGLNRFFNGIPCRQGHIAERRIMPDNKDVPCIRCEEIYREKNKEKIKTKLKAYQLKNKDYFKQKNKKYNEKNKERILAKAKEYQKKNADKIREKKHQYYENNKEAISLRDKENYLKNKEQILQRTKSYNQKNKEKLSKKSKIYYEKNKEQIKEKYKEYIKTDSYKKSMSKAYKKKEEALKSTIEGRLKLRMKGYLHATLKVYKSKKTARTLELIGCTPQQLKENLKNQFQDGMNWSNWAIDGWHIDHEVPIKYFVDNYDYKEEIIQKICWHYSNLRPMWAKENIIKGNKISKKVAEKKIAEIRKQIGADKRSDV